MRKVFSLARVLVSVCLVSVWIVACKGGGPDYLSPAGSGSEPSTTRLSAAPVTDDRMAARFRLGPHSVASQLAAVTYDLPSGNYSALRVNLRVTSFPNISSAETAFGLWFPFANGNAALLQLAPGKYATSFVPKPAKIISGLCYETNCQVGFVWKVNRPYQLALMLTSKSRATETWTGSVSQGKNKPRSIFSFEVPASWGLISPTQKNSIISLVVDYNKVSSCDVVPYAQVLFENPIATSSKGSTTTAKSTGTFGGPCKAVSYVGAMPTSRSSKIAIGTQWIPGATPQPSPVPDPGKPLFTPIPMPTGSPQHLSDPITVGPLQPVLPNEFAYGLIGGPDEALTSLRFSDGSTRVWMDSGELAEGCSFLMSTKDFGRFEFLPKPEPNRSPSWILHRARTDAYDANYAGPIRSSPQQMGAIC